MEEMSTEQMRETCALKVETLIKPICDGVLLKSLSNPILVAALLEELAAAIRSTPTKGLGHVV